MFQRREVESMYDREENVREINEAFIAGHRALECLRDTEKYLTNAKSTGPWDMFGGGTLSSLFKHSRIDDASTYMEEARHLLLYFQRELRDVVLVPKDLRMEIDGFLTFADFFLDGVDVDRFVQGEITQALEEVRDAIGRVIRILEQLETVKRWELDYIE